MRIPYPTRISPVHSATFAATLCVIQLVEGTPVYFSACTFLFIFLATLAFNAAGGLSRPSGAYVFFNALLTVIFGLVLKAFLGEAADTNLFAPQTTMLVYVVGMASMYVAVVAARRITPNKSVLGGIGSPDKWGAASIGCMFLGLTISLWTSFFPDDQNGSSGLLSILRQLNHFTDLGIILATMHTIRSSGGRRLWSLPLIVVALSEMLLFGIGGSSKQAFFTPPLCIVVAAAVSRYNFSFRQLAIAALGCGIAFVYIVPEIQLGKGIDVDMSGKLNLAVEYFTNTGRGGAEKAVHELVPYEELNDFELHYYNEPQGFADRLEMLAIDDALIDVTNKGNFFGIYPTEFAFINIIPHFIWPGKPTYEFGNMYWHEIGYSHYKQGGQNDTTTGISISPSADAYHEAGWYGVLLLAPAMWFGAFFLLDWLCGDVRRAPWGLVAIVLTAHVAPEGMLAGVAGLMTFGVLGISIVSLLAAYVMPIVALLIFGPGRAKIGPTGLRRSAAATLAGPVSSSANHSV